VLGFGDGSIIARKYRWTEYPGGQGWSVPQSYWHKGWILRTDHQPIDATTRRMPWHGFSSESRDGKTAQGTWSRSAIWIPLWLPAILLSIYPLRVWVRSVREDERRAKNQCDRCGYDLRESKDRCPECGNPIPVRRAS
jgi:hypothetical protein